MTTVPNPGCRRLLTHISAYLDGELPAVECAAIDAHCSGCAECAALVAGLRKTIAFCRETGAAPLPQSVRDRARESVRRLLGG